MRQTPLHRSHLAFKAKMTEFAGWDMPVSFSGIIKEHQAVRRNAGVFDIGHMGLINISGSDAFNCLQMIGTNDISKLAPLQAQYTVLCNEKGGTIDDIFVIRLEDSYLLIVNSVNTEKDLSWLRSRFTPYAQISPLEETHSAISLQGPRSAEILGSLCEANLVELKRNHCLRLKIGEIPVLVSRTGYTGEDGFEFYLEKGATKKLWDLVIGKGALHCGLGSRDTLRLEAALPLYGHEYNEELSPLEVGYKWAVKFDKGDFVGKSALQKLGRESLPQKLVGLQFEGRAIARDGFPVFKDAEGKEEVGLVTSGTFSPTLGVPIALAYLKNHRENPKEIYVRIRSGLVKAKVTQLPFYKRG